MRLHSLLYPSVTPGDTTPVCKKQSAEANIAGLPASGLWLTVVQREFQWLQCCCPGIPASLEPGAR
jgi:hypothetical protein